MPPKKASPKSISLNEEQQAVVCAAPRTYCIYLITNMVNGKKYCGQTCVGTRTRWNRHRYEANSGNETALYRAMRKCGESSFDVKVIEEDLTGEQANQREIYWIKELDLQNKEKGYNVTAGGESGPVFVPPARPDLDTGNLTLLYDSGFTIPQLAEKFKASSATISKKLHQQGVTIRPLGSNQVREDLKDEEIKVLYESGMSTPKIANKLGTCYSAIIRRLKKMGIKRRKAHEPTVKFDQIKATCMYLNGFLLREISEAVGAKLTTVHRRLTKLGVIYDEEKPEYS